jgi:membrane-bound lytic murein transglycosylase B
MTIAFPRRLLACLVLTMLAACADQRAAAPVMAATPSAPPAPAVAAPAPQTVTGASFADWMQGLRQEAAAAGVSQQTLDAALTGIEPNQKVLDLDRGQPEVTITFAQYAARTVTKQRIAEGRKLLEEYRPLLDKVGATYGVQPPFIVALWAIETDYGQFTGGYSVIDSLATLAYGSSRQEMFRSELIDALKILQQKAIAPAAMTGSWAGAMGQCQFMPSSYLKYAVAYSGSGQPDIWTNQADVFASIANYLASSGWRSDRGWGRRVHLPPGMSESLIDWKTVRPLSQWRTLGLTNADGSALPASDEPAALVAPDGPSGPAWLTTSNFKVIMKWNRSTYFAVSVGLLADGIAGADATALAQ